MTHRVLRVTRSWRSSVNSFRNAVYDTRRDSRDARIERFHDRFDSPTPTLSPRVSFTVPFGGMARAHLALKDAKVAPGVYLVAHDNNTTGNEEIAQNEMKGPNIVARRGTTNQLITHDLMKREFIHGEESLVGLTQCPVKI